MTEEPTKVCLLNELGAGVLCGAAHVAEVIAAVAGRPRSGPEAPTTRSSLTCTTSPGCA